MEELVLETKKFPQITFRSTRAGKLAGGQWEVVANLLCTVADQFRHQTHQYWGRDDQGQERSRNRFPDVPTIRSRNEILMKIFLVVILAGLTASGSLTGQVTSPDPGAPPSVPTPAAQPVPPDRPVSIARIGPNILEDQTQIWRFPAKLNKKKNWIPVALILGTTAGLIAADPHIASYFGSASAYSGFNRVFSSNATAIGTAVVPVSMYAASLFTKDSKMNHTALLAGEAVADSEILAYVLKVSFNRARPTSVPPGGNLSDSFYEGGSLIIGRGSMPSGHSIAAFSVATIMARRYGNHRWVPWVSYGLATAVGFSRMTLSAHYASDVFVGGALGYSVSRFAVLQQ
jgi:membrane-associated phospholipid phosphatase